MNRSHQATTKLVGILNLTPDSFSDGNKYNAIDKALLHVELMLKAGVNVIDIGAESTRPKATPISYQEEIARIIPILNPLKNILKGSDIEISIDTYHPETAKFALDQQIDIINDVSGGKDEAMLDLIINTRVKIIIMHNLGIPANVSINLPLNTNPVNTIKEWAQQKIAHLIDKGINQEQIIFDPGLGFGKTAEQSLKIVKDITAFKELDVPIFVGHSRKSFLKMFNQHSTPSERDLATCILSAYLVSKGVDYLRVHDVIGNREAIEISNQLCF